jgi:rare lipoprotein A
MKRILVTLALFVAMLSTTLAGPKPSLGVASWYGEDHRGRLMANGRKFNPDHLTAASWFYPLGTKVRVTLRHRNKQPRSVIVRITDRGPSMDLVRDGRIIDLTHAAFRQLSSPHYGLVSVKVEPL